jgi:ATP phosphoribosyltransferase regulatory subunit HisZ
MSDTPETDAEIIVSMRTNLGKLDLSHNAIKLVNAALSSRLERERDAARKQVKKLLDFISTTPCTCAPLFDDEPNGARFGPPCNRCELLEEDT